MSPCRGSNAMMLICSCKWSFSQQVNSTPPGFTNRHGMREDLGDLWRHCWWNGMNPFCSVQSHLSMPQCPMPGSKCFKPRHFRPRSSAGLSRSSPPLSLFNKSSASKRYLNATSQSSQCLLHITYDHSPGSGPNTRPGLFISGALQHIQRTPRALHLCRPAGHPRDVAAIAGAIEAASASLPAEDEWPNGLLQWCQ